MITIGDRIRYRRIAMGMTQDELAKKLGYKSRASINKIEMGHTDITQSRIALFADVLDTTPSYLMGWDDEEDADDEDRLLGLFRTMNDEGRKFLLQM
jgi:transcriptional regulator with XRE-family HTH domain